MLRLLTLVKIKQYFEKKFKTENFTGGGLYEKIAR